AAPAEVLDHRRIAAGVLAKLRVVVRVRQHARIQYPVGIQGDAVPVRERFEEQGERAAPQSEEIADPVLQHSRLQVTRVDAAAERRDAGEELPLALDRFRERLAGAGEPADQNELHYSSFCMCWR